MAATRDLETRSTNWSPQKWERMKIAPSGVCTDAEFIRRVYLDLTGLPPTSDQVQAFMADERETRVKRDELIDQLIGSPEYVVYWTNKWADLLQVNSKYLGKPGADRLPRLDRPAGDGQHAVRRVLLRGADRQRLEQGASGRVVLQDSPRAGRDDGEHDAPVPRRAVQLQQVPRPSVRALDAGPVLPDGRLLRPRRVEEGRRRRRRHHRRHRRRRGQAAVRSRLRQRRTAKSSTTAPAPSPSRSSRIPPTSASAKKRPAARSSPSGSRRRTTTTSSRATSTASGVICWGPGSSNRSTTSAPAIRRATRSCSIG